MAFCSGCGTEMGADVAFCPKCGKSTSATATPTGGGAAAAVSGLQENVAGLLCYVLGWVSGLVFFLIDKRPSVRFHAMQSIILFGALFILQWIFPWGWLGSVVSLVAVVCWILCMVKAFQGQRFKLPVIGDLAENFSK